MSENTKRQPKGIPVGGQFAANSHDEASALLGVQERSMDDIDWSQAEDVDDKLSLSETHRARLATLEDHILSEPHTVALPDGRLGVFWHERGSENTLDRRPLREARAIIDADGNVSLFQTNVDNQGWKSDDEFEQSLNADALPASNIPPAPKESVNEKGQPVFTGSRFAPGASASRISRDVRKEIDAAVKDGTLPKDFGYEVRGTDASGFGVVGVSIRIGNWKHGGNHGLIPGQSVYDQSPARAEKLARAERIVERFLEDHNQRVVLDESGTEEQHSYVWNVAVSS